jgi:hypothetical protein
MPLKRDNSARMIGGTARREEAPVIDARRRDFIALLGGAGLLLAAKADVHARSSR